MYRRCGLCAHQFQKARQGVALALVKKESFGEEGGASVTVSPRKGREVGVASTLVSSIIEVMALAIVGEIGVVSGPVSNRERRCGLCVLSVSVKEV